MFTSQESLAVVRLLIQTAKSDGTLDAAEKAAIQDAFQDALLPEGQSLEAFLNEAPVSLDTLAAQFTTREAREHAFRAAYVLAHADGAYTDAEKQFIEAFRTKLDIPFQVVEALNLELRVVESTEGPLTSGVAAQGADRASQVQSITRKYCILTSLSGAVPVPLIGDLLVIPMQMKMVYEIGRVYGQEMNKAQIKSMLGALGVGTGARLAVSSISKLIPGWGSFVGATAAYATTYALSHVAARHFESDGQLSFASLTGLFREKRDEGKQRYEAEKNAIEQNKETSIRLESLGKDLKEGRLNQAQYDQAVNELLQKV